MPRKKKLTTETPETFEPEKVTSVKSEPDPEKEKRKQFVEKLYNKYYGNKGKK